MKHRINGCPVNLRTLTDQELVALTNSTADRMAQVQEELDSLVGERIRRAPNVHKLRPDCEGPAVRVSAIDAPLFLMDPS